MKEKLKAFNSLETFNFYVSGHAQDLVALLHRDSSAT